VTRPVAVVTGAGSGIGAAIALRLANDYDLILTHRQDDLDLDDVLATVKRHGATTLAVTGDLTNPRTIDALGHEINHAADRLEVLVSNAGAYPRVPWHDLNLDAFRQQIEINLLTHAACAQLVTPGLTARGHGRIVTISSVLTQLGRVDLAGYIAAKSGLEGLVRALARELGPDGVTVNCIRAGSAVSAHEIHHLILIALM
jgi:NAD(P)-dependent dehydrogenase (short-subunit alcohol dehydrogenase family)